MALEPVSSVFELVVTFVDASGEVWSEVADELDLERVSVPSLDLNRQATAIDAYDSRLGLHWFSDAPTFFRIGFEWENGFENSPYWFPQGISGTADAYDEGTSEDKKFLVVSSYFKEDTTDGGWLEVGEGTYDKGVRVTFVDVSKWSMHIPYRHVLLVVPTRDGQGRASFDIVSSHGGGLVWYERYLYLASTSSIKVFDLGRMSIIPGDQATLHRDKLEGRIGYQDDGRYAALGYKYIIPMVVEYNVGDKYLDRHFSTISLDRSTSPPRIVSTQFVSPKDEMEPDEAGEYPYDYSLEKSLVLFWPIASSGLLSTGSSDTVESDEAWKSNLYSVQGIFARSDDVWFCRSQGDRQYLSYESKLGGSADNWHWARGGEGLHYAPSTDHLWNLTEHAGERIVFCIRLSYVGG